MDIKQDSLFFNDDMDMDGQDDMVCLEPHSEISSFKEYFFKPEIMQALNGNKFLIPTEVQSGCLIDAMHGKNILCQAKAGSGKATMSILAILHHLNNIDSGIYSLVICPTRHLVNKIIESYKMISKYMPLVKVDAFGLKAGNFAATPGVHIGVGTPGRVTRAIRNRKVEFSHVKHLVLYEADKMLSMLDMRSDIEEIYRLLPRPIQTFMLSEKFCKEVRPICKLFLQEPMKVFVDDEAKCISMNLEQFYIKVGDSDKYTKLLEILTILHFSLIIVYVKTPAICETLTNLLKQASLSVTCYHLGMKVTERKSSIIQFKKLRKEILVVTKLLDTEVNINVANAVILYDKPTDVDAYLQYVSPASKSDETKGLIITFFPENDDLKMIQELEDWYGATFTEFPSKIQLEVTSYNNCAS